jgi:hypothetical protein
MTKTEAIRALEWALNRLAAFGSRNHGMHGRTGGECRKRDPHAYWRAAGRRAGEERRVRLHCTCGADRKLARARAALTELAQTSAHRGGAP